MDLGFQFTPIEWAFIFLGCVAAIWIGASLAKKQARAFSGEGDAHANNTLQGQGGLPNVNFFDYGDMRFLHLGSPAVQGSMKISKPYEIHLDYVQRMMAWLLFADLDRVNQLHAMQLGLGAASLTKFCHLQLGMSTTAIELNPQVIQACRLWFKLPPNNQRLQVLEMDATTVANHAQWHGAIDALQVDLYDPEAAHPAVDSEDFYRDCRGLLSVNGWMTVNLFGRDLRYHESLKKIIAAFGEACVWSFKPTSAGNTVVLAFQIPRAFNIQVLQAQAQVIEARWSLPATKWLKELTPVHEDASTD